MRFVGSKPNSRSVFLKLFIAVWSLSIVASALVVFLTPKLYTSKARVASWLPGGLYDPTEWRSLDSTTLLDQVIENLDLNRRWRRLGSTDGALEMTVSLARLRKAVKVVSVRGTSLADVTVSSGNALEAAEIANAIANTYVKSRNAKQNALDVEKHWPNSKQMEELDARIEPSIGKELEIIDLAEPASKPSSPSLPRIMFIGILGGLVAACLAVEAGMFVIDLEAEAEVLRLGRESV